MDVRVTFCFDYRELEIYVFCTPKMKMQEVIEKFGNKIVKELDIKDYLFYHRDKIINPELTISDYQKQLKKGKDSNEGMKAAWDELEKSIVASIAKDVVVGVKGNNVELTIVYDYKEE